MDPTVATIIVAIITVIGTVSAAIITARAQVLKDIKKLPSWQLLYENDEHGNKITGDINKLIEVIGNAYPIRVKVYKGKEEFEMFEAEWVFVQGQSVLVQNTSQISTLTDGNFILEPYHFAVNAKTDGSFKASRITFDGKTDKFPNNWPTQWKRRIAWFGMMPSK